MLFGGFFGGFQIHKNDQAGIETFCWTSENSDAPSGGPIVSLQKAPPCGLVSAEAKKKTIQESQTTQESQTSQKTVRH